jgi:hypothetical protein
MELYEWERPIFRLERVVLSAAVANTCKSGPSHARPSTFLLQRIRQQPSRSACGGENGLEGTTLPQMRAPPVKERCFLDNPCQCQGFTAILPRQSRRHADRSQLDDGPSLQPKSRHALPDSTVGAVVIEVRTRGGFRRLVPFGSAKGTRRNHEHDQRPRTRVCGPATGTFGSPRGSGAFAVAPAVAVNRTPGIATTNATVKLDVEAAESPLLDYAEPLTITATRNGVEYPQFAGYVEYGGMIDGRFTIFCRSNAVFEDFSAGVWLHEGSAASRSSIRHHE